MNTTDPVAGTIDTYNTIAAVYTEKYFDDTSDFAHIGRFISTVVPHGKILEAGCGAGQFSKYLMSKGFTVLGVDLSESMLELARKKVPGGDFRIMDMRNLTFDDGQFDGIIAPYSLIHIPENAVVSTLKGFNRVLRAHGVLCVLAQRGESDHTVDEPFAPGKKVFFNFFTPLRIRNYLELAGFTDITVEEVPCDDPYSMSDGLLYIHARKS